MIEFASLLSDANIVNDGTPRGCTCFRLRKLARGVSRLYDTHLAQVGLKTTQYSLLKNIAYESVPVSVLAERMAMERTTLTRNLKPLIGAGWAELVAGRDARQKLVTVTPAGRERVLMGQRAWLAAQLALNRHFGNIEVNALHAVLDTVQEKISPLLKDA